MKVDINDSVLEQVDNVACYIETEFGEKSRDKFMKEYYHTKDLLAINPYIGPIEPSLAHLPIEFHSIVVAKKNKIIYYVVADDDIVKIVDFWDCRRNPKTLVAQVTDGK